MSLCSPHPDEVCLMTLLQMQSDEKPFWNLLFKPDIFKDLEKGLIVEPNFYLSSHEALVKMMVQCLSKSSYKYLSQL